MTTPNPQVRRATIEDLSQLAALWRTEGLPADGLDKRFKEFQVVEAEGGELRGALGLQIQGLEGHVHSEAFAHPEEADPLRAVLLQRMQILAANHGLFRLWTQLATPFWHANGFLEAPAEVLAKRPAAFGGADQPWLFLKLKDEPTGSHFSLEKEFALFRETEKAELARVHRQARALKWIATLIAVSVLLLILGGLVLFVLKRNALERRKQGSNWKPEILAPISQSRSSRREEAQMSWKSEPPHVGCYCFAPVSGIRHPASSIPRPVLTDCSTCQSSAGAVRSRAG